MTGTISVSTLLVRPVCKDTYEESGSKTDEKERSSGDASLLDDTRRHCGKFLLPKLDADEGDKEDSEDCEKRDDSTIRPVVLAATPLKGEQKANNHGEEDGRAEQIELLQLRPPAAFELSSCTSRGLVEECDERERDASNGQIDVETPTPGEFVSECAAL